MKSVTYILWTSLISTMLLINACSKKVILQEHEVSGKQPKSIILMIGDGMGLSHISAHLYEQGETILEQFHDIGLIKTHSANNVITDSGAAATAMGSGHKAPNNAVGVDSDTLPLKSIMKLAREAGLLTGIVTTSSILDATPAAFYAHQINRYFSDRISADLLHSEIDFLVGGGQNYFDSNTQGNLVTTDDLKFAGYDVFDYRRTPIEKLKTNRSRRVIYFNGLSEPNLNQLGIDHLAKASGKAIDFLTSRPNKGYFLMIEGATIDRASHAGRAKSFLASMKSFELAIRKVLQEVSGDKETLVIITADHATGGLAMVNGSEHGKVNLRFSTNGHTGTLIPVFATGPGSNKFRGVYENTDLFYKMAKALSLQLAPPLLAN